MGQKHSVEVPSYLRQKLNKEEMKRYVQYEIKLGPAEDDDHVIVDMPYTIAYPYVSLFGLDKSGKTTFFNQFLRLSNAPLDQSKSLCIEFGPILENMALLSRQIFKECRSIDAREAKGYFNNLDLTIDVQNCFQVHEIPELIKYCYDLYNDEEFKEVFKLRHEYIPANTLLCNLEYYFDHGDFFQRFLNCYDVLFAEQKEILLTHGNDGITNSSLTNQSIILKRTMVAELQQQSRKKNLPKPSSNSSTPLSQNNDSPSNSNQSHSNISILHQPPSFQPANNLIAPEESSTHTKMILDGNINNSPLNEKGILHNHHDDAPSALLIPPSFPSQSSLQPSLLQQQRSAHLESKLPPSHSPTTNPHAITKEMPGPTNPNHSASTSQYNRRKMSISNTSDMPHSTSSIQRSISILSDRSRINSVSTFPRTKSKFFASKRETVDISNWNEGNQVCWEDRIRSNVNTMELYERLVTYHSKRIFVSDFGGNAAQRAQWPNILYKKFNIACLFIPLGDFDLAETIVPISNQHLPEVKQPTSTVPSSPTVLNQLINPVSALATTARQTCDPIMTTASNNTLIKHIFTLKDLLLKNSTKIFHQENIILPEKPKAPVPPPQTTQRPFLVIFSKLDVYLFKVQNEHKSFKRYFPDFMGNEFDTHQVIEYLMKLLFKDCKINPNSHTIDYMGANLTDLDDVEHIIEKVHKLVDHYLTQQKIVYSDPFATPSQRDAMVCVPTSQPPSTENSHEDASQPDQVATADTTLSSHFS